MKYYFVYKTTNLVNGMIYVGCHQTDDLDDGYMGSGKIIKAALKKYGTENFKREILHMCENKEKMFEMEAVLVTPEFIKKKDNYNLRKGGDGGWSYNNSNSDLQREKAYKSNLKQKQYRLENPEKYGPIIEAARENLNKIHRRRATDIEYDLWFREHCANAFKGKKHTDETKQKIGSANSGYQSGSGNSNYGNVWIYSLIEKKSIRVKKEELDSWILRGWVKGRKMKFD